MRRIVLAGIGLASCLAAVQATELASYVGCTGPAGDACVPVCKASWEESKSSQPEYSMTCEPACARARDSWHAPDPHCRCRPPAGALYVKKRLYKADGEPEVERVPKYDVEQVPAVSCGCGACRGGEPAAGWDPLGLKNFFPIRRAIP